MRYFVLYRTTLRILCYLFRTLAYALWSPGALHEKGSQIRQDLSANYDQVQSFFRQASDIPRGLNYMIASPINGVTGDLLKLNGAGPNDAVLNAGSTRIRVITDLRQAALLLWPDLFNSIRM